jgi:serine/threonine-protein kinase HipA
VHRKKLRLAMAMRGTQKHYRIADIGRRHFDAKARLCGFGRDMDAIIEDIVERTPE